MKIEGLVSHDQVEKILDESLDDARPAPAAVIALRFLAIAVTVALALILAGCGYTASYTPPLEHRDPQSHDWTRGDWGQA